MNKKTAHTPGPWKLEIDTVFIREGVSGIQPLTHHMDAQGIADARLISSAPDLLVALKEAAKMLETARQYFPKSIHNANTFSLLNVGASINKAIAKAEGIDE